MLDAIYYPSYLPSKEWFKTQLLLWNRIYRIVPDPMESVFGAKKISSEWGLPEEYVQTLPVAVLDMNYLNQRKRAIIKQLKWLSTLKKDLPGNLPDWLVRVLKELDSEGFYTDAPFYLNTGKVPDWVGTKLLEYGLRRREKVDIYNNEHYVIRQDAAELLMSCLTHTMAAHRNMSPLTNREIANFSIYGNQLGVVGEAKPAGGNLKSLIAGVFEFMVPKNIDKLDFAEVVKIRDEYDDLRKGAANFIKRIADEFELERVVDEKRANELIGDATTEFKKKVEDFKRCSLRRIIKDWKTQTVATSIGMLGGYIAGGPGASVGIGIGGGVFSIINHFVGAAKSTQMEKTVRYFSVINRQIEQKEYIEGLLSYRRLVLGM